MRCMNSSTHWHSLSTSWGMSWVDVCLSTTSTCLAARLSNGFENPEPMVLTAPCRPTQMPNDDMRWYANVAHGWFVCRFVAMVRGLVRATSGYCAMWHGKVCGRGLEGGGGEFCTWFSLFQYLIKSFHSLLVMFQSLGLLSNGIKPEHINRPL